MISTVLMVVGGCVIGALTALGTAVVVRVALLVVRGPGNSQAALNAAQARIVKAQRDMAEKAQALGELPKKL